MKRAFLLLVVAAACGKQASGLSYTDPSSSGWRLVRSPASSGGLLVLDLLPPAGGAGRGVALTLSLDPHAKWARVDAADADYVHPGPVYQLGAEPRAEVGVKRLSGALVLGVFQKGQTAPAGYGSGAQPVLSVALQLDSTSLPPPRGTRLDLRIDKAQHLEAASGLADIRAAVAVGRLEAD